MRISNSPPDLYSGIDHLSFDTRPFSPAPDDIEQICRFFSLGKLRHYAVEKGITVSHSNFFVFAATTRGQYALKFYPVDAAKSIAIEHAVNRFLIGHHFPTPAMHAGQKGQPFLASHNRLAACYSYIEGVPSWERIKEPKTIHQINSAMFSLKNILSAAPGRLPFLKNISLAARIRALAQASRAMAPYGHKRLIDASLKDACQSYQRHQPLFTRQRLHNNAGLTNFLISNGTVYTLDLSHIREDYTPSDLASLVVSCLFFQIPQNTIKMIVKGYFEQYKIGPDYAPTLNTLIQIELIREYLKNVRRKKSADFSTCPVDFARTYKLHLATRKKIIAAVLRRMKNTPGLIK
ncbi:MAG: phosphotransferase [Candidatus Omnitrophota bacterium]|nr:phosphotransferase [Candidatus Omnitrophota bacterium]